MIETVLTVLSWLLIAAGAFFVVVGGVGLLRMPDVFTRMHAASVTDTVGAGLMLLGMMLAAGFSLISVKLLIILLVILFTSPVATHALAQATLHEGVEPILAKGSGKPGGSGRGKGGKRQGTGGGAKAARGASAKNSESTTTATGGRRPSSKR